MDEDAIKAMIAESLPDMEAVTASVAEQVMAMVSEAIPQLVASAVAGGEEPAAEEPALDAEEPEEPVADADVEDPNDENDKLPMADRLDSRLLDVVRLVERVTGKPADLKLSSHALLAKACKHAGLDVRADASEDRMLGMLEAQKTSAWRKAQTQPKPRTDTADEFISADEYNRRAVAAMAAPQKDN